MMVAQRARQLIDPGADFDKKGVALGGLLAGNTAGSGKIPL
jgi:hypothetical protein